MHYGSRRYPSSGKCIYCGARTCLTDEHIVPYGLIPHGLGDGHVINEGSCRRCAAITSRFEQEVLRRFMRDVRVLRGLKSRRRHRGASRTKTLIALTREGRRQELELALGQAPVLLHFPIFSPPALLDPAGYTSGIRLRGIHSVLFGPRPEHVSGDFHKIVMRDPGYMPVAFAKLLAKIAYGIAAAQGHLHRIDGQAGVLPAMLGQRKDIGVWVGTLDQPVARHEGLLHRILIHEDSDKGLLIGEVQLFADSDAPSYGVILGRLASSGP